MNTNTSRPADHPSPDDDKMQHEPPKMESKPQATFLTKLYAYAPIVLISTAQPLTDRPSSLPVFSNGPSTSP